MMGVSKIDVIEEKENALLNRKEYRIRIAQEDTTPSRKEISEAVKSKLKVDKDLAIVDKINQHYGKKESTAYVKVYRNREALNKIEPKYKIERMKVKEEAPEKNEVKKEALPEQKPAEKKEEEEKK